jgi:hypothetical protein
MSKVRLPFNLVMAGLVPAIPLRGALCQPKQGHRDKPGDDKTLVCDSSPVPLVSAAIRTVFSLRFGTATR